MSTTAIRKDAKGMTTNSVEKYLTDLQITKLNKLKEIDMKIILAIDIQNEYITEGRPFNIRGIESSLYNARSIIETARKNGVPVWHVKHEQHEKNKNVFVKGAALSKFVDGFQPLQDEYCFTKDMYSCFSSDEFTKKMAEEKPDEIVIIGYGTSMCCTCTIIDGIHRGYNFTLIEDATASRGFPHATEEEMHRSAINVLTQYAKIQKTQELIQRIG